MTKMVMILCAILFGLAFTVDADKPCAARAVPGQSVVCVCNATYCDNIIRIAPAQGSYVSYTSTEEGLRFHKQIGNITAKSKKISPKARATVVIELDPTTLTQTVQGFGGAVTDSAGINWKSLPANVQDALISSYFGDEGLQYNFLRVPIGGSDFSTRPYSFNELPVNDKQLTNYTLAEEDHKYKVNGMHLKGFLDEQTDDKGYCKGSVFLFKIPMIKACMQASSTPVHVVATTWSPPNWMKTNNATSGFSLLKKEYFQTYADYHLKFLERYAENGVPVWAITTTNEPFNGIVPVVRINALGWTPSALGNWIVDNLGPTIRNSTFRETKILAVDDQRYMIHIWLNWVVEEKKEVLDWIDGIAVHWYWDFLTPAAVLSKVAKNFPDKFILATEASQGYFPWDKKVIPGSWKRAETYVKDIIEDLSHTVVGWIDWNLCLDPSGGPNWIKNNVDSPILVYKDRQEFVKQPMFYAIGHFSKFVPRGSKVIKTTISNKSVRAISFLTPSNTTVVVLSNEGKAATTKIRLFGKRQEFEIDIKAKSITSVEMRWQL